MINKDMLIEYFRIISGSDADPNLTLVDFSLNDEQRNLVNLVNEEAKKDKKLARLLDDLKYSNNKTKVIEEYFNNNESFMSENKQNIPVPRFCGRIIENDYGFINMSSLAAIVGMITLILTLVISLGK